MFVLVPILFHYIVSILLFVVCSGVVSRYVSVVYFEVGAKGSAGWVKPISFTFVLKLWSTNFNLVVRSWASAQVGWSTYPYR